ncbi:alpha/beta hydrolase [Paenibacillus eucommiae]|uniref:Acetyl esterase/lipase n=1 Tax=Paenibacillus eucommiae TaxID=1355755 RepID=A0ABS4J0V1_9BACL|nr:alpha/beta hydrolase [Paenibacillus eucommiae]MBP1992399.1 acetyl esterase/lipase [Paenibacillus eucommiae]
MKKFRNRIRKVVVIAAACLIIAFVSAVVYYLLINNNPNLGRVYANIPYKITSGQELKLDIYMPERQLSPNIPMLVFFHGGGWDSGSKNLNDSDLETFNIFRLLGFAIVSVEYRLTNKNIIFPAPFADASDSIRWLHQNGSQYGLDNRKINLIGTSAGGQMALLEGLAGNQFKDDPALADVTFKVNSIVSLCGPTDLTDLSGYDDVARVDAAKLLEGLIGGSMEEMPSQYALASPINHINKHSPPTLISHGTLDERVPFQQAVKFYEAAKKAGARVTFIPVENADHKFKAPPGETTSPLVKDALRQICIFLLKRNLV